MTKKKKKKKEGINKLWLKLHLVSASNFVLWNGRRKKMANSENERKWFKNYCFFLVY